ncbi:peptidoglycan/LPS O-acetylase OafA/YrhL [Nitrobacter vulgaris]|uniref:acyltransferase family protein n=1 Tax=Nitrobacter vulgaris TaxID=29421 RepID=UPI002861C743|nr:acyltransferase [Nitrobacter vulgaris]MDR6306192.1 peptidoglycan/LPS O-acetylase OafA/YrhL [Nitrobacter vulgaris]
MALGTENQKLAGLQIARGLAALGIVYFHSWVSIMRYPEGTGHPISALQHWGFLGVNFFFALSGFVISLVVSKPEFSARSFFIKRLFRLFPIYWVILWLFVSIGHSTRGPVESETWGYLLYSAALLPTTSMPYLDVAWSLQHEVLFYIAAVLIVPILGLRGLAVTLAISAIAAFYFDIPEHSLPVSRYHADFLAGVLAFMWRQQLERYPKLPFLVAGICLTAIAIETREFGIFPFASFAIIYWSATVNTKRTRISKPFIALGDASYSLYLIHPAIFLLAHRDFNSMSLWAQEPIRWGSIAFCVFLSYVSWRFFEIPCIALGDRLSRLNKLHPIRSSTDQSLET